MAVVTDVRSGCSASGMGVCWELFPDKLKAELDGFVRRGVNIYEVRLRAQKCASIVCERGNIALSCVMERAEMTELLAELCEYSLYAYADTINRGYITVGDGIRVGVVGRAVMSGDAVSAVYDISSLCFRFPRRIDGVGAEVCRMLRGTKSGALIYSPPGVGKTTLLRCVVSGLADFGAAGGAMRVAVVDTRSELGIYLTSRTLCADVLSGYSRDSGIEIAIRSLNAELVVCDELCGMGDALAVIQARNSGVPVLATAHAHNLAALLRRSEFRHLHKGCAFEHYIGISRRAGCSDFDYEISSWEQAEELYG